MGDGLRNFGSQMTGGLIKPVTAGEGKSAKEMEAQAQRKADKETALRAAGMARNKTVFTDDESPLAPKGRSALTKKLG